MAKLWAEGVRVWTFLSLTGDKWLVALYGKRLAATDAVKQLESYFSDNPFYNRPGHRFRYDKVSLQDFATHSKKGLQHLFTEKVELLYFHRALITLDHEFFGDLSAALLRRKDPAYSDRFKVLDFLRSRMGKGRDCTISYDEMKSLGIRNVSRVVDELGMQSFVRKHHDRQGKRKNTKVSSSSIKPDAQ
jgi:hypothetical protein